MLAAEVDRCTGIGKCVAPRPTGVMCPSFAVTGEEKDSTRGRARVLQEMIDGRLVAGGWDAPEVEEALELCLGCKACASECPTGVDMGALRSEALSWKYEGRRRPRIHRSLGRLPWWTLMVPARILNLGLRVAPSLARRFAGVDPRRALPSLAPRPFHRSARSSTTGVDVIVWVDTFTNRFAPSVATAAIAVLRDAGLEVGVVADEGCCGLTWLSTGQIDDAREWLEELVDALARRAGDTPVVGLEPSCLAVLRHDSHRLLDRDKAAFAGRVSTLAEFLGRLDGWAPPDRSGTDLVVQPHCHHVAVARDGSPTGRSWRPPEPGSWRRRDAAAWQATSAWIRVTTTSRWRSRSAACCRRCARAATPCVAVADGFSCRTQIQDLAGRRSVHLAELLSDSLACPNVLVLVLTLSCTFGSLLDRVRANRAMKRAPATDRLAAIAAFIEGSPAVLPTARQREGDTPDLGVGIAGASTSPSGRADRRTDEVPKYPERTGKRRGAHHPAVGP